MITKTRPTTCRVFPPKLASPPILWPKSEMLLEFPGGTVDGCFARFVELTPLLKRIFFRLEADVLVRK